MTVPYGGVSHGERTKGASLRYQQALARRVLVDVVAGHTTTRGRFLDKADCVYDGYGRCVRERRVPSETDSEPHDQLYFDDISFGRAQLSIVLPAARALRISVAPTFASRSGDEREQLGPEARDPLTAQRDLFTMVNGVEHEIDLLDDQFENIIFGTTRSSSRTSS